MSTVQQRLNDLVGILLKRSLTVQEAAELRESYKYVVNWEWRMSSVMDRMKLAVKTRDFEWLEELNTEYEKLQKGG